MQEKEKRQEKHGNLSQQSLITSLLYCFSVSCLVHGIQLTSANSRDGDVQGAIHSKQVSHLKDSDASTDNGVGNSVDDVNWDHAINLNRDFLILWTIINEDITFEIQARALGYVGFGFSPNGKIAGSDIAVGWVDKGQTYFQDRHVKHDESLEPTVDPSQDYILIRGYENATHTVLRFRRKLDTCDIKDDIPITNDTMRLMYMYSEFDPPHGTMQPGTLPYPKKSLRHYRPMVLTQRPQKLLLLEERTHILELRNEDVELPIVGTTLYWCKMFKLDDINRKHHIIKYEPIYDSPASVHYVQHITLYECQGKHSDLEEMARSRGRQCMGARDIPLACNAIVVALSRGSEGFTFPDEAGYPIDSRQAKYYLMETHYINLQPDFYQLDNFRQIADNSGLKIYLTQTLRANDAGVLSIGMDPNWRHIIPPGQKRVVSEGQCMEDCTAYAFPVQGIKIFAVMMRTHQIGKEIKLRQIHQTEELPPIAHDKNIDILYQDFRRLPNPVHSMPGDRLIAECIYDSSSRKSITLGGLTLKEESCIILTLYYPRQKKLTTCHSLPSLPTVLYSLGIEQLATDSNPVLISAPTELAGMTLETRLISYDWQNQFKDFQEATRSGSFKPLCWSAKNHIVPGSEFLEGYSINLTKIYKDQRQCKLKQLFVSKSPVTAHEISMLHEMNDDNIIEGAAPSSHSSAPESQGLSKADTYSCVSHIFGTTVKQILAYFTLYKMSKWSLQ